MIIFANGDKAIEVFNNSFVKTGRILKSAQIRKKNSTNFVQYIYILLSLCVKGNAKVNVSLKRFFFENFRKGKIMKLVIVSDSRG